MPRKARLDIPGVLQHIMARGIEKCIIYRDHKDREAFLERLSDVITEGEANLYAWVLMPNHFHLLLRPQAASMADIMRRLLTGYSVWHNKRYHRKGHLFQNRYKSILVEEDAYFLELVRYIHLNPIRAKILIDPIQLDANPYTGHGVILGKCRYDCQDVDGVLHWFGNQAGPARKEYRAFVMSGFDQGVRQELRGGGLIRSAGGKKQLAARGKENREKGDERILGSGDFVDRMLSACETETLRTTSDIESILADVCRTCQISPALVLSSNRVRRVSAVRRLFFLRAHEEAGASYTALGRMCGLSHTSVRQAIAKARLEKGSLLYVSASSNP